MLYPQNKAEQYRSVRSHGLVADASPARLVQISFDGIMSHLAVAQGCMERIQNNLPLREVIGKGHALGKAIRLIGHLNDCLDLERGGQVASNLRNLYVYMLDRLTVANVSNDPKLVAEVSQLVRKIKSGWDQIVAAER